MGGDHNQVHLITESGAEDWPRLSKSAVADKIADQITEYFKDKV